MNYTPRILRIANMALSEDEIDVNSDDFELYYVRVFSTLGTFLLEDTGDISDDHLHPLEQIPDQRDVNAIDLRFMHLQHPKLALSSAALFCPEYDILWLGHQIDLDMMDEVCLHYGQQLESVYNVLFEETEWEHLEECMKLFQNLPKLRKVYVWLDSYRFLASEAPTTVQGYFDQAIEFQARDRDALRGLGITVEYIDYERNIYGGLSANPE